MIRIIDSPSGSYRDGSGGVVLLVFRVCRAEVIIGGEGAVMVTARETVSALSVRANLCNGG